MALFRAISNVHKHVSTTVSRQMVRKNFSAAEFNRVTENSEYHGFLTKGHKVPLLIYQNDNAFVFRLDVPGIDHSNLRCTANASKFSFTAQEPKPHRWGFGHCEPRYYEGVIEVDPLVYQPERFTANVNNGVLLVQIPKLRVGTDSPIGPICFHVGRIKTYIDADGNATFVITEPN